MGGFKKVPTAPFFRHDAGQLRQVIPRHRLDRCLDMAAAVCKDALEIITSPHLIALLDPKAESDIAPRRGGGHRAFQLGPTVPGGTAALSSPDGQLQPTAAGH